MPETGRYPRIIDRSKKRKQFHRLACLVLAGHVKNPLKQEVRESFHQAEDAGQSFNWAKPSLPNDVDELDQLFEIAVTLASNDTDERPIQERFETTLAALAKQVS